jgi:serine/threonine-protein kinase
MNESASSSAESDARFLPPVREGQTVAGKYLVGALLGVGGMGVVHAARDTSLDRRVALKVLLPRLVASKIAGERFLREARAATRITSEHVVKLLESDTLPDGTPLLVMEYLEGKDLRALLRESGPLSPDRAVDYLLQALQAIAEGHTHGIVHRDVKPSNLFLLERADGTPLIKVLDFGIAKTLENDRGDDYSLTNSEDLQLGSPTYMPPEQFHNPRDVDARADIWALGVTLYELISGKQPFKGKSYAELVSRVLNAPPDMLESTRILPAGLEGVIARCLEKERGRRYANAAELAMALAPFGSDDARLSLTRVKGLSRTRAPTPTGLVYDLTSEATLPVAIDAASAPQSATAAWPQPGEKRRNFSRKAFGVGVAMAALIVGAVILAQGRAPAPVEPRPVTKAATRAAVPAATPVSVPSPGTNDRGALPAAQAQDAARPSAPDGAVTAKSKPHRAAPHARNDAPPAALADNSATKASPASTGELGQSALIESLIQQRH